jgi:tetratricopeptide (TPR) repeat protein
MTATGEALPHGLSLARLRRLFYVAAGFALGMAAVFIVPLWFMSFADSLPRAVRRRIIIGFLLGLLVAYLFALALSTLGAILAGGMVWRARRRGLRPTRATKVLALAMSVVLGLALMEGAATVWLVRTHRLPYLPTRFSVPAPKGELSLVVVGESSAKGDPYDPYLSIGQILSWQLERASPGRRVSLEMLADGGLCLEQAIAKLRYLKRRPDVILLYSGHNEFQARFAWSTNARHYVEEDPEAARAAATHRIGRWSSLCRMILEAVDIQRLDVAPPKGVTRELVDHPCVSPEGYAYLRDDFHRRLEGLAAYCDSIGTLLILVVPTSNDGRSPPNRSILPAETTKPERQSFAREFLAVSALEESHPDRAEGAYRDLLRRQPGFAETHYRLARILERNGSYAEAAEHYGRARDLDGLPMRCPSDFRAAYYEVARRHTSILLVDGPRVIGETTAHGITTHNQFHDAQHPTFLSYLALARAALARIQERRALQWPEDMAAPSLDPAESAKHFGLDKSTWCAVVARAASYYGRTAFIRYDPEEGGERYNAFTRGIERMKAGASPEESGLPGVGIRPTALELTDPSPPVHQRRGGSATPAAIILD